jgi:hypothetical protein
MIKYVINYENFNIIIYKFVSNNNNIIGIINKIIHICTIMSNIANNKNKPKNTRITIFLGMQKKILYDNDNDKILCPTNINSGSSIIGINVMIWRNEEIYKVLIHELIHFYGFDFHIYNRGYELFEYISKTYNVKHIDSPNEAYTEFFATVIHTIFVAFYLKKPFNELFKYERIFTLFQIAKILDFYGINNSNDFGQIPIIQTTSVFSYFVLKGALLLNINKVFDFIDNSVKNIKITNRVTEYGELLKQCLSEEYFKLIDDMLITYRSLKETHKDKFIGKTMRMTCWQLD